MNGGGPGVSGISDVVVTALDSLGVIAATLVPNHEPLDAAQVRGVVDAAAGAGFTKLSAYRMHHEWAVSDGMTTQSYLDYHQEQGIAIVSVSLCSDWARPGEKRISDASARLIALAAKAQARTVVATHLQPDLPSLAVAARGMQHVCDLAASHGLTVSYEFIPGTGVPNLESALRLIDAVERENFGLILDAWQWFHSSRGAGVKELSTVSADRIHIVQLNDALAPDPDRAPQLDRLFPGEGVIDLIGILEVVRQTGAKPIVAAEVLAPRRVAQIGASAMAQAQFDATTRLARRYRASVAGEKAG